MIVSLELGSPGSCSHAQIARVWTVTDITEAHLIQSTLPTEIGDVLVGNFRSKRRGRQI